MNITSYSQNTRFLMPLGKAILQEDYRIVSGDEYIYKFFDKNSDRVLTDLMHPEDRKVFVDAAGKLDEGTQHVLIRFMTIENNYRYMLVRMRADKSVFNGSKCMEVYIADIIASVDKHIVNHVNILKYRRMMCLMDYLYFDYVKRTNHINIYMYANDKGYMFLSEDLDVWSEQMLSSYLWKETDKKKFETLCNYLKEGLDDFKMQLSTTFFSKAKRNDSILVSGSVMFDADGSKIVTGVIKLNAENMEKPYYTTEASKDAATGLMNKRAIMEYAAQKIKEAGDSQLELLVIDIDDFKNINDTYGHFFGDRVILRVAETLKRIVGIRGTVARFGGDEFVMLLENCDKESLEYILKTIYGELGILFTDEHSEMHITISVGIANYPKNGITYEALFKKADKALYIAKDNGKNNYVVYDEEKYKDIKVVSTNRRVKGLKSIASRVNRSVLFSDIILSLSSQGEEGLQQVVAKICDLYDLEGMLIFVGEDMAYKTGFGKYRKQLSRFSLLDNKDFLEMIKEDDIVAVEDINKFENKTFYQKYCDMEIIASVISIYRVEGVPKAVITFDTFNTSRQWNDEDLIALSAIGKLIGQKMAGE